MTRDQMMDKLQRSLPLSMRGDSASPPPPPSALSPELQRLKTGLARLRGVRRVRILAGADATEISISVVPERSVAETVADVKSVASASGVSTADLRVNVLGARGEGRSIPRRKLSSLTTRRFAHRFTTQVTLELMGDALIGEVEVPAGSRFEHRSVARAVLESVRRLLPYPLQLENVDVLGFGSERLAVVSVGHRAGVLVGSALVRADEHDAVARATLDAINRVIDMSSVDLTQQQESSTDTAPRI